MANRLALVDDDQNILASVSLALESEGYEVDTYFDSAMLVTFFVPLRFFLLFFLFYWAVATEI